jgi:hypothetical protein
MSLEMYTLPRAGEIPPEMQCIQLADRTKIELVLLEEDGAGPATQEAEQTSRGASALR